MPRVPVVWVVRDGRRKLVNEADVREDDKVEGETMDPDALNLHIRQSLENAGAEDKSEKDPLLKIPDFLKGKKAETEPASPPPPPPPPPPAPEPEPEPEIVLREDWREHYEWKDQLSLARQIGPAMGITENPTKEIVNKEQVAAVLDKAIEILKSQQS